MKQTKLILAGGFLGAGKTSLLNRAAELLSSDGSPVGLITNDQTDGLVDTVMLNRDTVPVEEVSGSCFCCNFPGLIEAIEHISDAINGGYTIAEPVGSCTDLSATIMQPIKDQFAGKIDLAPLTVLADPQRLRGILDKVYSTASYIVTKQFDEADIILINKIDVVGEEELAKLVEETASRWPNAKIMTASVKENIGVKEWLAEVLREQPVGKNLATVDYDLYADGEAAYGWLNATYQFAAADHPFEADAEKFLDTLEAKLAGADAVIGHVKFLLCAGEQQWRGNLTGMADHKTLQTGDPANHVQAIREDEAPYQLIVNARAEIGPKKLQDIVLSSIDEVFADYLFTATDIRTLIPGRPNPTHHYTEVV